MAIIYLVLATEGGGGTVAGCPGAGGREDISTAVRGEILEMDTSMGLPSRL
jgi:hypothetical protein